MSPSSEPPFHEIPLGRRRDLAEETAVVAAASSAGLFRALGEEPAAPGPLAQRLELDRRAVEILLPLLADLGLLETRDGRYAPTEWTRRTLSDPSSEAYAAGGLPLWLHNLRAFASLPRVLREGGPVDDDGDGGPEQDGADDGPDDRLEDRGEGRRGDGDDAREKERIARFMAAMDAAPRDRVRRIVDLCLARASEPRRVLDLGGGPGHMSREFASRGLEVVLFDQPATVRFVGSEYGLEDAEGIRLASGDFNEDPLPSGPFDVVLLSNVLHIYGPPSNRALLRKVAEVTAEGGVCAIAEFVRGASLRASRFAVIMLLKTESGNAYAEEEYAGWLREAGFRDPRLESLDEDRQLLTSIRV